MRYWLLSVVIVVFVFVESKREPYGVPGYFERRQQNHPSWQRWQERKKQLPNDWFIGVW